MRKTFDPKSIIFTPAEVSTSGMEYLRFRQTHKESGVPFPIKGFREEIYPLFPGELCSILARPGHGKSGVMMYWARQRAQWLRENGFENRVVVYATWEQSIEELHAFHIAANKRLSITNMAKGELTEEEWKAALGASVGSMEIPLWFIGHSVMRKQGRTPITVDRLCESLDATVGWGSGFEIDCVFVDYVQRIENEMENPVQAYTKIVDELKSAALSYSCPFVAGVQASRDVEGTADKIPQVQHGQWTSNIEQSSDRVISLMRPRRYYQEGEMYGDLLVEGHSQMLMTVLKQKLGEANVARWVYFSPEYNKLDDLELRHVELR